MAVVDHNVWPTSGDRCEPNLPIVGEAWSAGTGLLILAAGLIPLFTSKHSDDMVDLISATTALNGLSSALAHSTLLSIFGTADQLSINFGVLLYIKISIVTHSPHLNELPVRRGLVNLFIVLLMLVMLSWNKNTVPSAVINSSFDPFLFILILCFFIATGGMIKLAYSDATWHLGKAKRVFLRATICHAIGAACWIVESTPYMRKEEPETTLAVGSLQVVCPSAFFFLHAIWHVCEAQAIMGWIAFLKFHRGMFFGFDVEMRGHWWCPYSVWLEPIRANENPIIRHARSRKNARKAGRRNTYVAPKVERSKAQKDWRQVWRGASFIKTDEPDVTTEPSADCEAAIGPKVKFLGQTLDQCEKQLDQFEFEESGTSSSTTCTASSPRKQAPQQKKRASWSVAEFLDA